MIRPFTVGSIDPPWDFETWSKRGAGRSPSAFYDTMSLEEMMRLDMGGLFAADAALFMWVVDWMPSHAPERLAAAWGFTYKTRAWTWIKQNKTGWGFFTGKGYYTRGNPEDCLLFVRGKMPVPEHLRPLSVMREPVVDPIAIETGQPFIYSRLMEHSRKPDEQYRRIMHMYPDESYAEIFARRRYSEQWAIFGNEVESDFEVPILPAVPTVDLIDGKWQVTR